LRLVATDKDERVHIAQEDNAGGGAGLMRIIYRFKDMPLGKLGVLKFETRQYDTHVDFPNVVVVPSHMRQFFYWSALKALTGTPAPELSRIKGWKNGGPVALGDLRGKVVLLDFWNIYCGKCIHDMPNLMKLHDDYKDKGLVVISIHADLVESIAEIDEALASTRTKVWEGRDIPFLLALDGGGEVPIKGLGMDAPGATTANYRITSFPTSVLIDKKGAIAGEIEIDDLEATRKRIQELLR
jgi:thiol-disulfide isomerase/thioredoxin